MVNALFAPEYGPKCLIMTFHLTLNFSSILQNNFPLNIIAASVENYLKTLKKELKLLERQAQHLQYNNFQKRCLDLKTDYFRKNI